MRVLGKNIYQQTGQSRRKVQIPRNVQNTKTESRINGKFEQTQNQ